MLAWTLIAFYMIKHQLLHSEVSCLQACIKPSMHPTIAD